MIDYNAEQKRIAIKAFMVKHGLVLGPWSTKAGLSEGTLRSFLKGDTETLTYKTITALANAAGVKPVDLFLEENKYFILDDKIDEKINKAGDMIHKAMINQRVKLTELKMASLIIQLLAGHQGQFDLLGPGIASRLVQEASGTSF